LGARLVEVAVTVQAAARQGDGKRAGELLKIINPVLHATDPAGVERYKAEISGRTKEKDPPPYADSTPEFPRLPYFALDNHIPSSVRGRAI
jgi:hypothetical protein